MPLLNLDDFDAVATARRSLRTQSRTGSKRKIVIGLIAGIALLVVAILAGFVFLSDSTSEARKDDSPADSSGVPPVSETDTESTTPEPNTFDNHTLLFDFEEGDLQGWRVVKGNLDHVVSDRAKLHDSPNDDPNEPLNKQGKYHLTTGGTEAGESHSEKMIGVLESPVFVLSALMRKSVAWKSNSARPPGLSTYKNVCRWTPANGTTWHLRPTARLCGCTGTAGKLRRKTTPAIS